jgi:DNA modification methylase
MKTPRRTVPSVVETLGQISVSTMQVTLWPLEKIIPFARNARVIPQSAIDKVAASIQEFGFVQPIVVDAHSVVIIGHVRRLASMQLGMKAVPVHVARGLSAEKVRALRLADNRTNEETSWDSDLLAFELEDLRGMGVDLDLTGFNFDEIDAFLASREESTPGLTGDDAAPELPESPVSKTGDLWILGTHKLLVGDATVAADVERLMAGEAADLAFLDAPYNVNVEGYTENKLTIQNDNMPADDFDRFLTASFSNLRAIVKPGASLYICHASSTQREFQNALEAAGFEVRCQIIWAKNTFAWGFGRYKFQHEPIFYAHIVGQKDPWYGDKSQSTLWEEKKPAANRLHPTMKPVELIERALRNSSKAGDCVVDLFGGSGSTLIGCHKRGRGARLMEIDPRYVDVAVERWQDFTGQKATLEGEGRSFDEIAAERRQVSR